MYMKLRKCKFVYLPEGDGGNLVSVETGDGETWIPIIYVK